MNLTMRNTRTKRGCEEDDGMNLKVLGCVCVYSIQISEFARTQKVNPHILNLCNVCFLEVFLPMVSTNKPPTCTRIFPSSNHEVDE
jgi:hypothetical protein